MNKTVLGGGIGGLSAAYYLTKKFPQDQINLIEASPRTGGWIKSTVQEGILFEQGARTLRPTGYKGANTLQLVEELNLESKVLPLSRNDTAFKNRMIYVNGKLHSLPSSLSSLFQKQSPFTKPLIYYLVKEMNMPNKLAEDESIYSFTQRRFGKEIADYAISPLICGICAGDAHKISVKFLMEELFKYEQQHGSIAKGVFLNMFKGSPQMKSNSHLIQCAKQDKWGVYTFRDGIETLVKRLEEVNRINNVNIVLNSKCTSIDVDRQVVIHTNNNKITTEHLVSCIPANKLQTVLTGHPKLSLLLEKIPYVTVGVVNLYYKCKILQKDGFGFLIPPAEKLPILGVTFDSCIIPSRGTGTVLTVMMGGNWFDHYFGHNPSKEHLLDVALTQVANIMSVKQTPDSYLVNLHKNCIAQYIVGHSDLVKQINNYVKSHRLPLTLCGSSYNGVGINDVIWSSKTGIEHM